MRLAKTPALLLPLAALAIAGCGGGSDSSASTPTTTETTAALSKADLISKGDAICAEVNAGIGSLDNAESEVANTVIQVSDLYINMVDSLKSLGVPTETAGYEEFIGAGEELSKVEGEAKLAAERGDSAALSEAATRATPALEEFEAEAGAYGFEQCSEGPKAPTPSGGAEPSGEAEEGGVEVAPEVEEAAPEEAAPEEAPETGGAGGGVEEAPAEGGGAGGGETGGSSSGGVGPG
jgi:hypothetical protein